MAGDKTTQPKQGSWAGPMSSIFLCVLKSIYSNEKCFTHPKCIFKQGTKVKKLNLFYLTYFRVHLPCCLSPRQEISSLINNQTQHQLRKTLNYFNIITRAMPGTPYKCYINMSCSSRPIVIWLIVIWPTVSAPFLPVDPHQANEN